eukprot:13763012-Heterocapsa_arctica.AAC.1
MDPGPVGTLETTQGPLVGGPGEATVGSSSALGSTIPPHGDLVGVQDPYDSASEGQVEGGDRHNARSRIFGHR